MRILHEKVRYLGHVIQRGTLSIEKARTAALTQAKHPKKQTQLRSFLGLCNVYRRFVLNFSHIPAPLNKLLKKEQGFDLSPLDKDQSTAFTTLIKAVTTPPVQTLPKSELPYSIDTDAHR